MATSLGLLPHEHSFVRAGGPLHLPFFPLAIPPLFLLNLSMKFAIYHCMREWAHELGDPKLAEVEAATKEEAERLTAHLGETGTWAVPIPPPKVLATKPRSIPALAR
jgi:hypothetical protein